MRDLASWLGEKVGTGAAFVLAFMLTAFVVGVWVALVIRTTRFFAG